MSKTGMLLTCLVAIAVVGCQSKTGQPTGKTSSQGSATSNPEERDVEAKVASVLSTLSAEDRELAESQKFCAVMTHERLGGMGSPLKLDLNGEPVFVCCKGCRSKALKKPEETLTKVAELKKQNAGSSH